MAFAQADAGAMQYLEKCSPLLHMFHERKAPIPLQNTCAYTHTRTCVCVCVCAKLKLVMEATHSLLYTHITRTCN